MMTCTTAKKPWPLIARLTWSVIWLAFSRWYLADSVRCLLNAFDSRIPETLRVSCVIVVSSDSDSCVCAAIFARTCPTLRWMNTRIGISTTAISVSRQSIRIIATSAEATVTALPRMLEMVLVSTPATAPTSFCSRDWITPVLVRVKNASSIAWRCSNSLTRRSPVTRLPTVEVSQVCVMPNPDDSRYSAIMAATSRTSSPRSGPPSTGNSASSNTRCTISGGTTAIAALTTTISPVTAILPR